MNRYFKCIDNDANYRNITVGKIYKAIYTSEIYIAVIDDKNAQNSFFISRFQEITNELTELLYD